MIAYPFSTFDFADTQPDAALWLDYKHLAQERRFSKGDKLVEAGTHPEELFFIKSGKVRMEYCHIHGTEKVIWYFGKNLVVGETPLFQQSICRTSFVCTQPTVALAFSYKMLTTVILPGNPHLAQSLLHGLTAKVRFLVEQVFTLSFDPVTIRYCKFLRLFSKRLASGELVARPTLRQHEIASLLGVHRTTLYKSIRDLERKGILAEGPANVKYITDEKRFLSY